jgi:protein associated with RNAse G/E
MEDFLRANPREKKKHVIRKEEAEEKAAKIRLEREIKPIESGSKRKYEFGDKGASWRMMKLQRVFDSAKEEKKSVEDVALDRFGSLEDFQEAMEEREYLDKKLPPKDRPKREQYRSLVSKSQFKAPLSTQKKVEIIPTIPRPSIAPVIVQKPAKKEIDALSKDQLNSMYAKVLKARLLKSSNIEELEEAYFYELGRSDAAEQEIRVIPSLNSQGQINVFDGRDRKEKLVQPHKQETHDRHGNRIANLRDGEKSLTDLVREEKLNKSHNYDKDLAHQIQGDGQFINSEDYIDQNSDAMSRKKEQTFQKQQKYAMKDYQRTEKALEECIYCIGNGKPPKVSIIAKGIKTYLALPETIDMITYHCLIVPIEHVLSTLELDDDTWDEIRVSFIYLEFQEMFNSNGRIKRNGNDLYGNCD